MKDILEDFKNKSRSVFCDRVFKNKIMIAQLELFSGRQHNFIIYVAKNLVTSEGAHLQYFYDVQALQLDKIRQALLIESYNFIMRV